MSASKSSDQSRQNSDARKGSSIPQHQKQDICPARTNRHPHPNLARTLCDGISDNTINADGCKRQCQQCKDAEQNSDHPLSGQGVGENLVDGFNVIDRLSRIEISHSVAYFGEYALRVGIRADEKHRMHAKAREIKYRLAPRVAAILCKGMVQSGLVASERSIAANCL
jgi:hypothetical protein